MREDAVGQDHRNAIAWPYTRRDQHIGHAVCAGVVRFPVQMPPSFHQRDLARAEATMDGDLLGKADECRLEREWRGSTHASVLFRFFFDLLQACQGRASIIKYELEFHI